MTPEEVLLPILIGGALGLWAVLLWDWVGDLIHDAQYQAFKRRQSDERQREGESRAREMDQMLEEYGDPND